MGQTWDGRPAFGGALVGLAVTGLLALAQSLIGVDTGGSAPPTQAIAHVATAAAVSSSPVGPSPLGAGPFGPIVTDRIPAPAVAIPLDAPVPGTTNMQPSAAAAFTAAFADASAAGLGHEIRSAWRSEQWQQVLFDRAVTRYGSAEAAARWVLRPQESAHVKGYAVDVHPQATAGWLEEHGAAYGICRRFANEWWHFEYLATTTCPALLPSATPG